MNGKTVLVTGATRGLGLGIARRLLASGYTVVATGRSRNESFDALAAGQDGRLAFMPLELSDTGGHHDFIGRVTAAHGPLWGLVNNAAVARDGVLATLHDSDITETVAVNVTGTVILTKYAIRSMLAGKGGRVVNVASVAAFTGFNGLAVYAASKSAMIGFTRSLAREVGRVGITVNAVAPGYMETDMTAGMTADQLQTIRRRSPLGRFPEVDEVAGAVDLLLGEDGGGITGTTLTVDAGSTA